MVVYLFASTCNNFTTLCYWYDYMSFFSKWTWRKLYYTSMWNRKRDL